MKNHVNYCTLLLLLPILSCVHPQPDCQKIYNEALTIVPAGGLETTNKFLFDVDEDGRNDVEFIHTLTYGHIEKAYTISIHPLLQVWEIMSNVAIFPLCQDTIQLTGEPSKVYYSTYNCAEGQMGWQVDTHEMVTLFDSLEEEEIQQAETIKDTALIHDYAYRYFGDYIPDVTNTRITKSVFLTQSQGWIVVKSPAGEIYGILVQISEVSDLRHLTVKEIKRYKC